MEDEVSRMNVLIGDMLELAKYESGTYKMDVGSFYIDTLIERVCTKLTPDFEAKRLLLSTSLIPALVEGNERRIEQVIVNFLTNAISYTPEHESILVTTSEERDTVQICIENKGAHIPDEQLGKNMGPFLPRGNLPPPVDRRDGAGSCHLPKKFLEMHGAAYGVNNTSDGVMFYFSIE
ncbi:ATP-binding protein [Paenibacillus rhizoplanae]